ncbi:MAG: MarC family protein [Bacteroidetes bacterium]|jgi:multiple antibiotic resistance protein|nr:MarC family protein [Bacteroidota bacterium]MBT3422529.1 MarC family protein [Bacteroidota bacterium]MBT3801488.1 MarC family protein [Bacteroidota bacterium]MBT3934661.1 MarC family protein [Bacteroidota bacterium]MBT4337141.1 MarC family protein [Bacteroidota bacterium]
MDLQLSFKEIFSVTLVLFAVIDILGSVPIVIDLKIKAGGKIQSGKATIVAGIIMILFLFLGESILSLFGVDFASFAIAGAIVIFFLALEMVLGVDIFKQSPGGDSTTSIVPLAFPLIAGAGTLTTILSIRAEYQFENVLIGIIVNLLFVFLVLKSTDWIQKKIGHGGVNVLRKIFGIILLAIAIKLFRNSLGF